MISHSFPKFAPGTVFEKKYEVIGHIGQGGMGTVYRMRHLVLDDEVAVKLIPLVATSATQDLRARFADETRLMARMRKHPHIVPIFDGGVTDDGLAYIVMELVAGASLRAEAAIRRPTDAEAIRTLAEVLSALTVLHAGGILHRDIKPENILLRRGTRSAVLIDFGLARVLTAAKYATAAANPSGTLFYMPPEQLRKEGMDGTVDIFPIGVIGFELLVGRHPRTNPDGSRLDRVEVMQKLYSGDALPRLSEHRPDLPPTITAALDRSMSPKAAERPSAKELYAALYKGTQELSSSASAQPAEASAVVPAPTPAIRRGGTIPMNAKFPLLAPPPPIAGVAHPGPPSADAQPTASERTESEFLPSSSPGVAPTHSRLFQIGVLVASTLAVMAIGSALVLYFSR